MTSKLPRASADFEPWPWLWPQPVSPWVPGPSQEAKDQGQIIADETLRLASVVSSLVVLESHKVEPPLGQVVIGLIF